MTPFANSCTQVPVCVLLVEEIDWYEAVQMLIWATCAEIRSKKWTNFELHAKLSDSFAGNNLGTTGIYELGSACP